MTEELKKEMEEFKKKLEEKEEAKEKEVRQLRGCMIAYLPVRN